MIAFSLFGSDETYTAGAMENARLARIVYPGWTVRFYAGRSVPADVVQVLRGTEAQVIREHGPEDWSALLWRFRTLSDPGIQAHLFRDTDSRLSERESAAVADWLDSGAEFHIMRDHPEHYLPIMAGIWGCTAAGASRIVGTVPWGANEHRFVDQKWLRDTVYPMARTSALVHSDIVTFGGETVRPFPTPRRRTDAGWEFVGQAFTADGGERYPGHAGVLGMYETGAILRTGGAP